MAKGVERDQFVDGARTHRNDHFLGGLPQFCENLNPFPFPAPLIYLQQFANKTISPPFFLAREQKYAAIVGITTEAQQATGFEPARDQGRSLRISKYGGSELRGLFRNW